MDRVNQLASSAASPQKVAKLEGASVKFIASAGDRTTKSLGLTVSHYLDAYSKGKWNLSCVPCPPCFSENPSLFQPPECYNDATRCKVVQHYKNLPHWNESYVFKSLVGKIRKEFGTNGVSISVIDGSRTYIKYQHLLDLSVISRIASIDSHTILSQGYFLLSDASKDWRIQANPFVNGITHIRYYLGVPLMTRSGISIGALAIFDSFTKSDTPSDQIKALQGHAKEVMKILDSQIETVKERNLKCQTHNGSDVPNSDNYADEIKSLTKKIGRATSKGETMINVFEKDGSGGPYSQNHNFRFFRFNSERSDHNKANQILFEKLLNSGNLKNGASQLAKSICSKFGTDFVYVLEIRIAELYRIKREFFPAKEKTVEAEKFKYASKLVKCDSTSSNALDCITRVMGFSGNSYSNLHFENEIHLAAFSSEFGIHYENSRESSIYNEGIIMPFFRHPSKLVRKNKVKNNDESLSSSESIEVYLRSGGFLIGCFNEAIQADAFGNGKVSDIFEQANILRKIYISS